MDADGEPGVDVAAERKCVERRNPGSLNSRGAYRGPSRRVTGKHTLRGFLLPRGLPPCLCSQ